MKIYTRTGDTGETSLFGGSRVQKNDPRLDAYGTIDELNSYLGLVRSSSKEATLDHQLEKVQRDLFEIGAQLASPGLNKFTGVKAERTRELEAHIDEMESHLPELTNFILPGGSVLASQLHVARTICRRAERLIVALDDVQEKTIAYLNRLSDYLFVAARAANQREGEQDVTWSGE